MTCSPNRHRVAQQLNYGIHYSIILRYKYFKVIQKAMQLLEFFEIPRQSKITNIGHILAGWFYVRSQRIP